jgi:putative ATP-binding cassette transporter
MADRRGSALFGRRFARHVARLIGVYWASPEARVGFLLLAGAVTLELGTVFGNVLLSDAERRIMDAVQDKEARAFLAAVGLFAAFSTGFVIVSAFRVYLRQLLEIRWRRGVTADYVERWVNERAYAQVQLHGDAVDNPDQRITEDVRDFVASALGLSLSLLAAVATLVSFGGLLWRLSGDWALPVGTGHVHIPGFMLWVALLCGGLHLAHASWGARSCRSTSTGCATRRTSRENLMRSRQRGAVIVRGEASSGAARSAASRTAQNWWRLIDAQRRLWSSPASRQA